MSAVFALVLAALLLLPPPGVSLAEPETQFNINGHWEGSLTITGITVVDPDVVPQGDEGCGMALVFGLIQELIGVPIGMSMDVTLDTASAGTSYWLVDMLSAIAELDVDESIRKQLEAAEMEALMMPFTLDGTTITFTPQAAQGVSPDITAVLSAQDGRLAMDGSLRSVQDGIRTTGVFSVTSQEPGAILEVTTTVTTKAETGTTETENETSGTTEETTIGPPTTQPQPTTTVTTLSEGEQTVAPGAGGAGDVPGPSSWWDWLKGTAAAGAIASGIGLLSTLGAGAAGAAPVAPLPPPPLPPQPGFLDRLSSAWTEAKDVGSFFVQNVAQDVRQTVKTVADPFGVAETVYENPEVVPLFVDNVADDMGSLGESLKGAGSAIGRGLDALWNGLKNPDTWVKGWDNTKAMAEKAGEGLEQIEDYLDACERTPGKMTSDALDLVEQARAFGTDLVKDFLNDPLGPVNTIVDDFDKAMDPSNPVLERLGHSVIGTLNAIGLIEGGGAVKELIEKGVGRVVAGQLDDLARAAAGKVDDLAKVGAGSADDLARAAADTADDAAKAGGARIPVLKERPDNFRKISPEKAKEIWKAGQETAEGNVRELHQTLATGDQKARVDAVLKVQKDPLSVHKLNSTHNPELINGFKQEIGRLHDEAIAGTKAELARIHRVDPSKVECVAVTNKPTGLNAGMDKDFTFRIDGKDVDARDAQKIYDAQFHKAAGSPEGISPTKLGKSCRNTAVDSHSPEALGYKQDEWKLVQAGQETSHADTVARSAEYKATGQFAKAGELAGEGKVGEALNEQFLGLREMGKEYTKQIEPRMDYLRKTYATQDPARVAWAENKVAAVKDNIEEVNRMMRAGTDPVEIERFLQSKNTSSQELANQLADIYTTIAQ